MMFAASSPSVEVSAVAVFCALCLLLFVGNAARARLTFLQRLYLPSSVIGGLLGLLVVSLAGSFLPDGVRPVFDAHVKLARDVPGFLINVIFATLFLGKALPRMKTVVRLAFPQLCVGQIMAWGQYVVGLGLTGFVFKKLFFGGSHVSELFGNLLEVGFEGGHGTVSGLEESFKTFGWAEGTALGYTMATAGMIIGIVLGMAMVQWAFRRGIVKEVVTFDERKAHERRGVHLKRRRPDAGKQTVMCDSIDSLAWHIAVVGLAVLIGFGMLKGLQAAEVALFPEAETRIFRGFPLFPLCMLGGVLLQFVTKAVRKDLLIDRGQMERISGATLDFLVVSAVATIQLKVVAANWQPLVITIVAGTAWSVWVVMRVAPRVFRTAWFERAMAEFGQATGVTATGLMLLRTVDPENRTPAAVSFGYKQLLQEPVMSGIWTALAFTLVFNIGWFKVWLISLFMLLVWGGVAVYINRVNARSHAAH
jgi:ESS family glutamate:Na+ symporter